MRKPKVGFIAASCPTHITAQTGTGEKWVDESFVREALDSLNR